MLNLNNITNFKISGDDSIITRVRISTDGRKTWGVLFDSKLSINGATINVIEDTWGKFEMDIILDYPSNTNQRIELNTSMIQQSPAYPIAGYDQSVEFSVLDNNAGFKAVYTNNASIMCDCMIVIDIPETDFYKAFTYYNGDDYHYCKPSYTDDYTLNYTYTNGIYVFTCSDSSIDLSDANVTSGWDYSYENYSDRIEVRLYNDKEYTADDLVKIIIPGTDTRPPIIWEDYIWLEYEDYESPYCSKCGDLLEDGKCINPNCDNYSGGNSGGDTSSDEFVAKIDSVYSASGPDSSGDYCVITFNIYNNSEGYKRTVEVYRYDSYPKTINFYDDAGGYLCSYTINSFESVYESEFN